MKSANKRRNMQTWRFLAVAFAGIIVTGEMALAHPPDPAITIDLNAGAEAGHVVVAGYEYGEYFEEDLIKDESGTDFPRNYDTTIYSIESLYALDQTNGSREWYFIRWNWGGPHPRQYELDRGLQGYQIGASITADYMSANLTLYDGQNGGAV